MVRRPTIHLKQWEQCSKHEMAVQPNRGIACTRQASDNQSGDIDSETAGDEEELGDGDGEEDSSSEEEGEVVIGWSSTTGVVTTKRRAIRGQFVVLRRRRHQHFARPRRTGHSLCIAHMRTPDRLCRTGKRFGRRAPTTFVQAKRA